jgi:hypothetical protein
MRRDDDTRMRAGKACVQRDEPSRYCPRVLGTRITGRRDLTSGRVGRYPVQRIPFGRKVTADPATAAFLAPADEGGIAPR